MEEAVQASVVVAAAVRVSADSRSRWLVSWSFPFWLPPPSVSDFTGPLKLQTDEIQPTMLRKLPFPASNLLYPHFSEARTSGSSFITSKFFFCSQLDFPREISMYLRSATMY